MCGGEFGTIQAMNLLQTTQILRKQHDKLWERLDEIFAMLEPQKLSSLKEAIRERNLLSEFMGVLEWHFGMEDDLFYPELLKHESAELREMAQRYIDEIGGLKARFAQYNEKWEDADSIIENLEAFISETKELFESLSDRIRRENDELFVLIETLEREKLPRR